MHAKLTDVTKMKEAFLRQWLEEVKDQDGDDGSGSTFFGLFGKR